MRIFFFAICILLIFKEPVASQSLRDDVVRYLCSQFQFIPNDSSFTGLKNYEKMYYLDLLGKIRVNSGYITIHTFNSNNSHAENYVVISLNSKRLFMGAESIDIEFPKLLEFLRVLPEDKMLKVVKIFHPYVVDVYIRNYNPEFNKLIIKEGVE